MRELRRLDKLIDEPACGKKMEKILQEVSGRWVRYCASRIPAELREIPVALH